MVDSRIARTLVLGLGVILFVASAGAGVAAAAPSKTLDNLTAAFNGESNAHAKYLEFAKKADQEGYAGAAALFRAAARAEETHARTHGEVITKLGGSPKAEIKLPAIGTTAENLKAALAGERRTRAASSSINWACTRSSPDRRRPRRRPKRRRHRRRSGSIGESPGPASTARW